MDIRTPEAAITAPGICHNLPIGGHPAAREVTYDNGVPVSHLVIGFLATGQPVAVASPSLTWLDELGYQLQVERARLAMWHQDHHAHPFGDAA